MTTTETSSKIEFVFVAARCDGRGEDKTIRVRIPDDENRAFIELADDAYERAHEIAERAFGGADFDLYSE